LGGQLPLWDPEERGLDRPFLETKATSGSDVLMTFEHLVFSNIEVGAKSSPEGIMSGFNPLFDVLRRHTIAHSSTRFLLVSL
jgi:hypothetical protein